MFGALTEFLNPAMMESCSAVAVRTFSMFRETFRSKTGAGRWYIAASGSAFGAAFCVLNGIKRTATIAATDIDTAISFLFDKYCNLFDPRLISPPKLSSATPFVPFVRGRGARRPFGRQAPPLLARP